MSWAVGSFEGLRGARHVAAAALLVVAACDCSGGIGEASGEIEVTPQALVFGGVPVGTNVEQFVEVRNVGRAFLEVTSVEVVGGPRADLAVTRLLATDCEGGLRAEGDRSISSFGCARFVVRYAPTAPGALAAQLKVVSDAQNLPELLIDVSGSGVLPAIKACVLIDGNILDEAKCTDFSADPARIPVIDFGPVPLGERVERKVRVSNEGLGPLDVKGAHVATDEQFEEYLSIHGGDFTATLVAGEAVELTFVFTPQGDGPVVGTVVIPSNDPRFPTLELPITAHANGPRLCVLPEGGIDFGSVQVGTSRTLALTLENCGQVPYDLTELSFGESDRAQNDYVVGAMPGMPHAFPPGARLEIPLTYTPTTANRVDEAFFGLATEYQRGSIPVTGRGAPAACGPSNSPVARIRVTNQSGAQVTAVEPLSTVVLNGTGSTGGTLTYQWRLVSQPPNGTVSVTGTGSRAQLFVELAGDYVVELVVKNTSNNCQSAPATVTVKGQPTGRLHIQVTWPQSHGDVDLHYVGPGGSYYNRPGDVYYGNTRPDWGAPNPPRFPSGSVGPDGNAANNATLDADDTWGNGPENVNHDQPFDGVYEVWVTHYCSRQGFNDFSSGPVDAGVRIIVPGQADTVLTKRMTQRDKWKVATITVDGGVITVTPSNVPVTKSTAPGEACTGATN